MQNSLERASSITGIRDGSELLAVDRCIALNRAASLPPPGVNKPDTGAVFDLGAPFPKLYELGIPPLNLGDKEPGLRAVVGDVGPAAPNFG